MSFQFSWHIWTGFYIQLNHDDIGRRKNSQNYDWIIKCWFSNNVSIHVICINTILTPWPPFMLAIPTQGLSVFFTLNAHPVKPNWLLSRSQHSKLAHTKCISWWPSMSHIISHKLDKCANNQSKCILTNIGHLCLNHVNLTFRRNGRSTVWNE